MLDISTTFKWNGYPTQTTSPLYCQNHSLLQGCIASWAHGLETSFKIETGWNDPSTYGSCRVYDFNLLAASGCGCRSTSNWSKGHSPSTKNVAMTEK